MAKTPAAKRNVRKPAAKEAPGADAAATEKQGAPTADQAASVVTDPPASNSTEAGTESAPPASSDADAEAAAATAAAAVKLDSALSGHPVTSLDVIEGAGGVVTADPASEIQGTTETRVAGWVVECKRARGIWRAGRFWPPVPTAVPGDELTDEQLTALQAEPLLSVVGVE
ncbi:MAG: hypothetical protein ABIF28_04405 [Pseudomonadota bacterium]